MDLHWERRKIYSYTFIVWQSSDVNIIAGGTYCYHWAMSGKRRDYKTVHPDCSANN